MENGLTEFRKSRKKICSFFRHRKIEERETIESEEGRVKKKREKAEEERLFFVRKMTIFEGKLRTK